MKGTALFVTTLLAACAHSQSHNHTVQALTDELNGKWHVTYLHGQAAVSEQGLLLLDSANGHFSLNFGCNILFGGFTQTEQSLVFTEVAATLKMCDGETMQWDNQAAAALAKTRGYRRQGAVLELTDAGGKPVLVARTE